MGDSEAAVGRSIREDVAGVRGGSKHDDGKRIARREIEAELKPGSLTGKVGLVILGSTAAYDGLQNLISLPRRSRIRYYKIQILFRYTIIGTLQ